MADKNNILFKLIHDYIAENGYLFFPDGIYGGNAYFLDEKGFFGPIHIHDYIVPASFSESAKKFLCHV